MSDAPELGGGDGDIVDAEPERWPVGRHRVSGPGVGTIPVKFLAIIDSERCARLPISLARSIPSYTWLRCLQPCDPPKRRWITPCRGRIS